MTFVEALGGQNGDTVVEALGGQKGDRFEEIMEKKEVVISNNPLANLAVDFDIAVDTDLLGKVVGDLQEDMAVDANGVVTGTAHYVTSYTGFSGDETEQEGNYVAFHVSVGELVIGTNVTVKVNNVTMDPDGLFVMRFKDGSKKPKAIVTAFADGHAAFTKVFDFTKVVRESAE